jgi:ribosomal protein S21
MGIEIKLRENEDIESAIKRLNDKVFRENGKRWYKRRYGYYEKPSILKRKRNKHVKILRPSVASQMAICGMVITGLQLKIGIKEQYKRTGPNNAAGR